jgi:hypothetical protein
MTLRSMGFGFAMVGSVTVIWLLIQAIVYFLPSL